MSREFKKFSDFDDQEQKVIKMAVDLVEQDQELGELYVITELDNIPDDVVTEIITKYVDDFNTIADSVNQFKENMVKGFLYG